MAYRLCRVRDGAGDCGSMSKAVWEDGDDVKEEDDAKPRVGVGMVVGSWRARSFSNQDYWITTPVTEIIEEDEKYVKFKTKNSTYEWFRD